jgi:hypothetical protein
MQGQVAVGEWCIAPRERLRDRLRARLGACRLDLELANGTPPEVDPALARRARRLIAISRRREIAVTIRQLLRDARTETSPSRAQVCPPGGRIAPAAEQLNRLADALARPEPVSPRGVALALTLLRDGVGPLYNPDSGASLRARAASAADHLHIAGGYTPPGGESR